MDRIKKMNAFHLDILKEIGNIGAGHAANALSKLIGQSIEMNVPSVKVVSFDEMTERVGGSETVVVAIFLRVEGDVTGSMFFILSLNQASHLIKRLTGKKVSFDEPPYDEFAMSVLQETGNILTGSYISSFADFTKLNLQASVPVIGIDMAGALLNDGLIEISQSSDYAIMIDTVFLESPPSARDLKTHVLLLPDPDSFATIFSALGVPING